MRKPEAQISWHWPFKEYKRWRRIRQGLFAVYLEYSDRQKIEPISTNFRQNKKIQILNHLPRHDRIDKTAISCYCPFNSVSKKTILYPGKLGKFVLPPSCCCAFRQQKHPCTQLSYMLFSSIQMENNNNENGCLSFKVYKKALYEIKTSNTVRYPPNGMCCIVKKEKIMYITCLFIIVLLPENLRAHLQLSV